MNNIQTAAAPVVAPAGDPAPPGENWSKFTANYCQMRRFFNLPVHYTGLALSIRTVHRLPLDQCMQIAQLYVATWLKLEEMNTAELYRMGVRR